MIMSSRQARSIATVRLALRDTYLLSRPVPMDCDIAWSCAHSTAKKISCKLDLYVVIPLKTRDWWTYFVGCNLLYTLAFYSKEIRPERLLFPLFVSA